MKPGEMNLGAVLTSMKNTSESDGGGSTTSGSATSSGGGASGGGGEGGGGMGFPQQPPAHGVALDPENNMWEQTNTFFNKGVNIPFTLDATSMLLKNNILSTDIASFLSGMLKKLSPIDIETISNELVQTVQVRPDLPFSSPGPQTGAPLNVTSIFSEMESGGMQGP